MSGGSGAHGSGPGGVGAQGPGGAPDAGGAVNAIGPARSGRTAYIFDFDGVLANTMEAHFACYRQALEEVGVPIDRKQFWFQAGMKGVEQISWFARAAGKSVDAQAVYNRKREIFKDHAGESTPIEPNIELLRLLRAAGHPVAIASGSSRNSVLPMMKRCGIEVDALVGGEDVTRGKPAPDLFLTAAARLGTRPEDCIVIEDSEVGIESAKAAGMRAMRFYDRPPQ